MSAETNINPPSSAAATGKSAAGMAPMPLWLVGLFALMAYGGMIYVANHGGWFSADVYPPFADKQALEAWARPPGPGEEIKRGQAVFRGTCEVCHMQTGLGSAANGCPPLDGSEWVLAPGPNRIVRIVLNGLAGGPLEVKGTKYGTGSMAVGALTDQQIADVLTYIRSAWSNKGKGAGMVTPDQVKAIREKTKDKIGQWSPPELLNIPEKD